MSQLRLQTLTVVQRALFSKIVNEITQTLFRFVGKRLNKLSSPCTSLKVKAGAFPYIGHRSY
jgi:hypothetical protein